MGRFIVTGQLTDREMMLIQRDVSSYKHKTYPAQIYSPNYTGVNRDIRDCSVCNPTINDAKQTYNILQSIVIQHYAHLCIDISNVSELQYVYYNIGGKFDWHSDILSLKSQLTRGFTLSLQLTDPQNYTGGDLLINDHGEIITCNKTAGCYVIFPAYTRHQVNPVISGARESLIAWIHITPRELEWLRTIDL